MTLVELMIVVVVLGILSSLGMVGYRRYLGRARATEAVAMLAEITAKEQIYFTEFASYLPLVSGSTSIPATAAAAVATETAANFYPRDPTGTTFDSVRSAAAIGTLPLSWQQVAVRPRDTVLYCSYFAGAGVSGSLPPASSATTIGAAILGSAAIPAPWFYALGACNLRGSGAQTYPAQVTVFSVNYASPSLTVLNDGN
jgi:prepilin-type N-terminal cleavage/methylation domain-containing protein